MRLIRLWMSFILCGWLVLLLGGLSDLLNWAANSLAVVALGIAGVEIEG